MILVQQIWFFFLFLFQPLIKLSFIQTLIFKNHSFCTHSLHHPGPLRHYHASHLITCIPSVLIYWSILKIPNKFYFFLILISIRNKLPFIQTLTFGNHSFCTYPLHHRGTPRHSHASPLITCTYYVLIYLSILETIDFFLILISTLN